MSHQNVFPARPLERGCSGLLTGLIAAFTLALATVAPANAMEPGRGLTKEFEIEYLRFIANHHFAALRMTELAAGTLVSAPMPDISPDERIQPTPGFAPTEPKATLEDIKTIARGANRAQREEILEAQRFLRNFYGIEHEPMISPVNQKRIDILERAAPGDEFNQAFLEVLSRHHFTATGRSSQCLVATDVRHNSLQRYCRGIVNAQVRQIDKMRDLLCANYEICDYQPLEGLAGRHSEPGVSEPEKSEDKG